MVPISTRILAVRKNHQGGRKPIFNAVIFKERFNTIERVFGWKISSGDIAAI